MSPQRDGDQELFWREVTPSWVINIPLRLAPEEESTLQFYSDFAGSLAKAEVKPESSR
jgi:hypothetical protein